MRITSPARVPSSHHFGARHAAIFVRGGIFALLFALFLVFSPRVSAQITTSVNNSTSTPVPGSDRDYIKMLSETVDPASGSVSVRIQVPLPKGRGLTLPFAFAYDSGSAVYPMASNPSSWIAFSPTIENTPYFARGGWSYTIPLLSYSAFHQDHSLNGQEWICSFTTEYVFQDASGARHLIPVGTSSGNPPPTGNCPQSYAPASEPMYSGTAESVVDADGTVYSFPGAEQPYAEIPATVEDRNGNKITIDDLSRSGGALGAFTEADTAGRTVLSSTGFGMSGNTVAVSGLANPYVVSWGTSTWNFAVNSTGVMQGCPAIPPAKASPEVVTSIELPNGQSYKFYYDPTYGTLSEVNFPSGGYISYSWGLASQSGSIGFAGGEEGEACNLIYDKPAILHRYVSFDGKTVASQQDFSYSTTWNPSEPGSWTSKQTTVTTHDLVRGTSFQTVYNYSPNRAPSAPYSGLQLNYTDPQIPQESSVEYKDVNGSVLETVAKTWHDLYVISSQTTTLGASGPTSKVTFTYGSGDQVTEKDEYDFDQTSPSRRTVTAYQTFAPSPIFPYGPSIFDRPSSVITYDGGGNRVAETDYSYDQGSLGSVSGLPSGTHDETNYGASSTAPRGNVTTVTKQCFPNCVQNPDSYTAATTTYSYDETGQAVSATAPCGNAKCDSMYYGTNKFTTYAYADNYTSCGDIAPPSGNTNAYLTRVTNEKGFITSYCYDYMEGQLRSSTDENSQVTAYQYNDPLDRLKNITYPIGATIISYNDAPPNPTITTEKEIQPGQYLTTVSVMDGIGHIIDNQLTSASACQIVHTTTSYDGEGNPYQVSNPYCSTSDPTYGLTTYVYDALGRTKTVTHPDSTSIQSAYTGRATQVSDEGNGTKSIVRISQTDGLGRLSSVCEVTSTAVLGSGGAPSACGQDISATGFLTSYTYNALDDLTQVSEGSLNPRTFTYNSLSELVCSANPEIQPVACPVSDGGAWVSGTTRYTYDLNGNLLSKTSPAPNQTNPAVSVHTAYGHDVLNRQMDVWPPNGEPDTFYGYDLSGYGYSTGRLTGVGRYDNSDSNWYSYTAPSYDAMGRVTLLNECAVQDCPATHWDVTTGYDDLSDITSWTNAFGGTFSATYNNAQQLTNATNNLSNGNYPSPMLSSAIYNAPGQLISAQIGTGAGVVTETRAYDKRLRPTTLTDGVAYSFNITNYAPDSDILAVTDSVNGAWGYGTGTNYTNGYDDVNRLLMAVPSGKTWSYTYAYDRYGNRWQQNLVGTGGSGPQFSTTFDANNHVSDGTVSYDAAGNVMQDASNTYTYDSQNQMISSLSRSSGVLTCYFYDAFGRRVQKATGATSCGYPFVGGTSLYYVYDTAGNVIDEVSAPSGGTGNWTRQEIYAAGIHLATFNASAGQAYWDFSDWLGTERARVNAVTGAVAETCTSLPWGDNLQCTGTDQSPLHFTGKQRDTESGLDNFGARYNSSSLGRFMSPDPSPNGISMLDPQSWNLYSYVRNRPTRAVDVEGNWATDVHAEITTFALQGYVSAGELQELVSEQYAMDKDQSVQSRHAMAVPGQKPGPAKDAWESYVASKVDEAGNELTPDGNFTSAALRALGDAIHTLQDYSSPMHTSADGDPQVWYGLGFKHLPHDLMHWAGESSPDRDWSAIGFAVRLSMAALMETNPKLATSEGLTDKTFNEQANQRIMGYVSWYYSLPINGNADPMQEDAARLCALGNPAACL